MIRVEELTKTYQIHDHYIRAVEDVTAEMHKGEISLLFGPSGSGKSTLLGLMGLLLMPTKGRVFVDGEEMTRYSENWRTRVRREKMGFVFQQFNLLHRYLAWENVSMPLVCRGVPEAERRRTAEDIMKRLGLGDRLDFKVAMLSGGEQQRVAVARALVADPTIILADEPTASVDKETASFITETFLSLKEEGRVVVLSSHDPDLKGIADHTIVLEQGRVAEDLRRAKG